MTMEFSAPRSETVCIDPPDWAGEVSFTPRKQSWVAVSSGCFYKIIRKSNDPLRDAMDPACIDAGKREYADMLYLARLSDKVCRPLRMEQGCIVYPCLSGPDMCALLRFDATSEQREACLREAILLLAQLHAGAGNARNFPLHDYRRGSYVVPDTTIMQRIEEKEKTIVIGGFEVRNLRFDAATGTWRFFDPHHLWRGAPEEDFARFIVSLLMVNWGRGGALRCWRAFDVRELLAIYESAAAISLDKVLLNYFLQEKVAMRKWFAVKALRSMHPALRVAGRPYLMIYFKQLEKWRSAHEV